jgi:hypothetical protein
VIYSYLDAFEARWLKRARQAPRGGATALTRQPADEER